MSIVVYLAIERKCVDWALHFSVMRLLHSRYNTCHNSFFVSRDAIFPIVPSFLNNCHTKRSTKITLPKLILLLVFIFGKMISYFT